MGGYYSIRALVQWKFGITTLNWSEEQALRFLNDRGYIVETFYNCYKPATPPVHESAVKRVA